MPTYPLATLAATVSAAGVSIPTYADILASLKASAAAIFGNDVYLEDDSQDGQLLAVFAAAIHDCNLATVAVYNAFSPATAQGAGLSSVVKINHMKRAVATHSQVNVSLGGQAGTTIVGGIVGDVSGNRWLLPASVTIPPAGAILVTATAEKLGATQAVVGAVTKILTPTAGWQSVTNPTAATPGQPVETDAELRARQEAAPAIYSMSPLAGLVAAISALPGVVYSTIYENDTNTVDANGLPPHSIAAVIKGGDVAQIASTLYTKKSPGVATHGTTTVQVRDVAGDLKDINFFVPDEVGVKVALTLVAGSSYTTAVADEIKQSIVSFIAALSIGEDLVVSRLYAPALLLSAADSETYKINALQAGLLAGALGTTDIPISFTSRAVCSVADVTITLV